MTRWLIGIMGAVLFLSAVAQAQVLGKTAVTLDWRLVSSQETNYGNFVADAVRDASGAQIAIVHAMAFRAEEPIDKGVVDEPAIRRTMASPSSSIIILQLTPAKLHAVMTRALSRSPYPNAAFLQISGMQVVFDSAQPAATRVTSIIVAGHTLDLADTKTTFRVAMPRELAAGAAGYVIDFTEDVLKTMKQTNSTILDAIAREFQHVDGIINPVIEERVKSVKAS